MISRTINLTWPLLICFWLETLLYSIFRQNEPLLFEDKFKLGQLGHMFGDFLNELFNNFSCD